MPNMNAVAASELAAMRTEVAAAVCDLLCTISRATTTTNDAYGSKSETFTTIATTVAGMRQPTAGQLASYASLIGSLASWQVQLPYGTDCVRGDHLTVASQKMVVQVDLSPQSYNTLATFLAVEVK